MAKTVWLCASTLPARLIRNSEGLPEEIWVTSSALKASYDLGIFAEIANPLERPKVKVVGQKVKGGVLSLFLSLTREKRAGTSFVFFHECCWPLLDLFLLLIRPSAVLYPQVSMAAFPVLSGRERRNLHLGLRKSVLTFLASPVFEFRMVKDQGRTTLSPVCRKYPNSVVRFPYVPRQTNLVNAVSKRRRVLFVGAVDLVEPDEISRKFVELAHRLKAKGIGCSFKDHPNPDLRLGGDQSVYDTSERPEVPIEFILDEYSVLIGLFSTSLIGFPGLSVSIAPMWKDRNTAEYDERMRFFGTISRSSSVVWASSLEDAEVRIAQFLEIENDGRDSFPE